MVTAVHPKGAADHIPRRHVIVAWRRPFVCHEVPCVAQGAESPKVSASNTIKATVNPKRQIHGVPRSCMVRPGRRTTV